MLNHAQSNLVRNLSVQPALDLYFFRDTVIRKNNGHTIALMQWKRRLFSSASEIAGKGKR
jgi:hypothetical protein